MGDKFRPSGRAYGPQGETSSIQDMFGRILISIAALVAALAVAPPAPFGGGMAHAQQQQPAPSDAQRIEALEERIRDMQAVIGTLQSFVREGGGGAAAPGAVAPGAGVPAAGGAPSELSIRVLALETQIRALTGQMKDVIAQLEQGGGAAPAPANPWQQGGNEAVPPPAGAPLAPPPASAPQQPRFGAATNPPQQTAQVPALPAPSLPSPSLGGGDARSIYDASYQSFVRNDLAGAENGFRGFIKTHPDNPLTTNAYYWLGRTHFDRQQYEQAAKAFLAGYKRDKQGAIAPDSLLHLGLSLARLGENEAACSTLTAVPRQYPSAPEQLRQAAADAIKKARC